MIDFLHGDCRQLLKAIPSGSIHCCVTSPPYWGLRDYGVKGQIGLEPSLDEYIDGMVAVFREVRRVLRDDGTLWVNMGDSYNSGSPGSRDASRWPKQSRNDHRVKKSAAAELKHKDLVGQPWMLAFALRADGWYLRSDIIWHKPNPMPESVYDRPTKAHEYIFLLSKRPKYYYDYEAIMEPVSASTHARMAQQIQKQAGSTRANGGANRKTMKAVVRKHPMPTGWDSSGGAHVRKQGRYSPKIKNNDSFDAAMAVMPSTRNKRSVWKVGSAPFKGAHFATYPPELIRPCIRAGCPVGGTVLDPFGGSGTTALVADQEGRNAILIELNGEYVTMQKQRTQQSPLLAA